MICINSDSRKALNERAMEDKIVILTMLNEARAEPKNNHSTEIAHETM